MKQHFPHIFSGRDARAAAPTSVAVSAVVGTVLALGALVLPQPTGAITTFQNGSCTACAPTIPGAVSTYIPDTAFPAGNDTPIAFVDPNDGIHHRFVATQQGAILVWNTLTHSFNATPYLDLRNDGPGTGLTR